MPLNVKISLCKITRASKLFARNYYLPLLKPLSPKDALRRKIITGQNVLGNRIEHYIPCLETYEERKARRNRRPKGAPVIKKRVRMNENNRYVTPFFDDDMEGHTRFKGILGRKPKGRGQHYCYEIVDKNCVLVVPFQFERAIRDKEIIDVTVAQRSEKIVVKLAIGIRVTVPIAKYDGNSPLYRGSGWTREAIEEEHHHGRETFSLAKIFEAKEQGVEEWELEMMRMANKRKKKLKGEDSQDWKAMLTECVDNMDWDKFEEDTKQIVEEKDEYVEEEDIPMAVDDMEKTKNVNEKLKNAGQSVVDQLPVMKEVPEVIKNLEAGELCEIANVSGIKLTLSGGKTRFVAGQMVKGDDSEVFVPGQTVPKESGTDEYIPGITINMEDEPTLIPGLVFGEEEKPAIFLPGESTITGGGQLQFQATEEDLPPSKRRPPTPSSSSSSPSPEPERPRKKIVQEIVIKRRNFDDDEPPKKERVKRRGPPPPEPIKEEQNVKVYLRPQLEPIIDPLKEYDERRKAYEDEQKKKAKDKQTEKMLKEEAKVDKLRLQLRQKLKNFKVEQPPEFVPVEPVKKSKQLEELETSISKGTFFDDDKVKTLIEDVRNSLRSSTRVSCFSNSYSTYGGFGKYNPDGIGNVYIGLSLAHRVPGAVSRRDAGAPV